MSILKRLLNNGLASLLLKCVRIVEQLALVPIFISAWGLAAYGDWLTLSTVPTIVALADFGFGTASANDFILKLAAKRRAEAFLALRAGQVGVSLCAAFVMALVAIGALAGTLLDVEWSNYTSIPSAPLVFAFLAMSACAQLYLILAEGMFIGQGKAAYALYLQGGYYFAKVITVLLLLKMDASPLQVSMGYCTVAITFAIAFYFHALQQYRGESLPPLNLSLISRQTIRKGCAYMMIPAWQAILFQGTTVAVRVTLGAEAVAVFNSMRTLSRTLSQLINIVNGAVSPELQVGLASSDRREQSTRMFAGIAVGVSILGLLGTLALGVYGEWLYRYWTRGVAPFPPAVWVLLLTAAFVNAQWWFFSVVFRAVNQPERFAFTGVMAATLSVLLCFFTSNYLGLAGAAFAALFFELYMTVFIVPSALAILGLSARQLIQTASGMLSRAR